jgi:putative aminopeptidase FrvX
MNIDTSYLVDVLQRLIATPSPAGDSGRGVEVCRQILCELRFESFDVRETRKGDLLATIGGDNDDAPRALTAHVDTLAAVARAILPNGRLQLAQIGSYFWSSIENENVTIETASGATFRGTVLPLNASYHTNLNDRAIDQLNRESSNLEVRIDADTSSPQETAALGIAVGDYIHFDPKFERNGDWIKARHLDDKECIACIFAALKMLSDGGERPAQTTTIQVATYEEVQHSGPLPDNLAELVVIDIAPLGAGQNSREHTASICILDKDGPYDRQFSLKLQRIAQGENIELRPDIYPRYSSDGKAFWKAGGDARVALFGPAVDCTHGYERTHLDALVATTKLIAAYLRDAG